jgi:hypothetical protein
MPPMSSMQSQLASVQVGHIIHGRYPALYPSYNGEEGNANCFVYEVTEDTIRARSVTTQCDFAFDRDTGIHTRQDGTAGCRLDSIAPLPSQHHSAMLDIDRKYRLPYDPEGGKLLRHEIEALLFATGHYAAYPLNRELG